MKVTWKHLLGGSAATLLSLTALVGFAHTKPGQSLRPLLFAINQVAPGADRKMAAAVGSSEGACPLGYDQSLSRSDLELQRQQQVAGFRGATPASSRPALGFTLGQSQRADVQAWAAQGGVSCSSPRGPAQIVCVNIASERLPEPFRGVAIAEAFFQFDQADRLVAVGTMRSTQDAELAVRVETAIDQDLARQLGSAGSTRGERQADKLLGGLLNQLRTEYRFSDYFAATSVTHMGQGRMFLSDRFELLSSGS